MLVFCSRETSPLQSFLVISMKLKEIHVYDIQTPKYFTGLEKQKFISGEARSGTERVLEIYLAGIRIITLTVETKEYSNKTCRNSLSAAVSRIYIDTRAVTVNTASDLPLPKNLRQFLSSKLSFLRTTLTLPSNILLGVQNRSFGRCFAINILYSFAWFIPATCPAHGNKVIKIADLLDM